MRKKKVSTGPYLLHLELLRERVPSFDYFPYCLPALRALDRLSFHPKVTFLVGENGAGKSTVLGSDGVREVPYQETEHYLVARGFLANPQRTLRGLLGEEKHAEHGGGEESCTHRT